MTKLTLISKRKQPLKPLIEAALNNELRLLMAGIQRTEKNIHAFEFRFGMKTADFLKRYENNELDETLELADWIGEFRMLNRLKDKLDTLQAVQFAD
ncbi:hypothetical protein JW964_05810 [candidate division KSB1 bacterium]|nr:hypothetical protein [candidate division KSB1 bacterium]